MQFIVNFCKEYYFAVKVETKSSIITTYMRYAHWTFTIFESLHYMHAIFTYNDKYYLKMSKQNSDFKMITLLLLMFLKSKYGFSFMRLQIICSFFLLLLITLSYFKILRWKRYYELLHLKKVKTINFYKFKRKICSTREKSIIF